MRFSIDEEILQAAVSILNEVPAKNSRPVLNAIEQDVRVIEEPKEEKTDNKSSK